MLHTAQYPHLAPHFVSVVTRNIMEQFVKSEQAYPTDDYSTLQTSLQSIIGQSFSYNFCLTTEVVPKPLKVSQAMRFLRSALILIIPKSVLLDIEIALEEVVSNIVEHSYLPNEIGEISFDFTLHIDRIIIQVDDFGERGRHYQFEKAGHFDSLDELRKTGADKRGGMGVFLVRKIMDEVTYSISPGEYNRIRLVKYFQGEWPWQTETVQE